MSKKFAATDLIVPKFAIMVATGSRDLSADVPRMQKYIAQVLDGIRYKRLEKQKMVMITKFVFKDLIAAVLSADSREWTLAPEITDEFGWHSTSCGSFKELLIPFPSSEFLFLEWISESAVASRIGVGSSTRSAFVFFSVF